MEYLSAKPPLDHWNPNQGNVQPKYERQIDPDASDNGDPIIEIEAGVFVSGTHERQGEWGRIGLNLDSRRNRNYAQDGREHIFML